MAPDGTMDGIVGLYLYVYAYWCGIENYSPCVRLLHRRPLKIKILEDDACMASVRLPVWRLHFPRVPKTLTRHD